MKKIRTFSSSEHLSERLLCGDDLSSCRIVSFDVFDTLLFRRTDPKLILHNLSEALKARLYGAGLKVFKDPVSARHSAYLEIIEAKTQKGFDPDLTLSEWVPVWIKHVTGLSEVPGGLIEFLYNLEIEYELKSLYANEHLLALVKKLSALGYRTIFASDMYLGAEVVGKLLSSNGFDCFSTGYVSGDYGLLKRTGRLFGKILETENVVGADIIHVGDNYHADGTQASQMGLRPYVLQDPVEEERIDRLSKSYKRFSTRPSFAGEVASLFAQCDLIGKKNDPCKNYAFNVLGPIFTAFIHRLAERCREESVSRVYFFAREGFLLKQLFEKLSPLVWPNQDGPQPIYLCVSRLTTFLASSKHFGLREIEHCLANCSVVSVENILAPYRIKYEVLSSRAALYGLDNIRAPIPKAFKNPEDIMRWESFGQLINDYVIAGEIERATSESKALLGAYLESVHFFEAGPIAVVDVGWSGQIQDNIFEAFKERQDFPFMHGFYLGVKESACLREKKLSRLEGVLADLSQPEWHSSAAFQFVQAFEAIARAPHATVMGYRIDEDSKSVSPILKDESEPSRAFERRDDGLIAVFQYGILDYVGRYVGFASMAALPAKHYLPHAKLLLDRMVRFPSLCEFQWFSEMGNVSDLGSDDMCKMGGKGFDRGGWNGVKARWGALKSSFWKNGAAVEVGLPGLGFLIAVYLGVRFNPKKRISRSLVSKYQINYQVCVRENFLVDKSFEAELLKKYRNNLLEYFEESRDKVSVDGKVVVDRAFRLKSASLAVIVNVLRIIMFRRPYRIDSLRHFF